ncbi:hypothetical protein [Paenibacillus massiliensis]|uniref:hypothetical protein n=1 Tax=Paenibacillus massiliensis TaxID=225917 RepID=UPI0003FF77FA|nr:hypothetical protein [Paenibacillus massiliensis]
MTTTYKGTFQQMQQMYEDATKEGQPAIDTHLKALAFSLGAQAVLTADPRDMPQIVNELMMEFGKGVQATMLEAHSMDGSFGVRVHAVQKSN